MKILPGYIYIIVALAILLPGCKKPYNPAIVDSANSYLVVEGAINSANDSTVIKLSKTVKISGNVNSDMISDANVTVESESGGTYTLVSQSDGTYISTGLNLDASKKYRLHITTADNKEYASDYEVVKASPPIDSIGFKTDGGKMQVYVNAHDATANSRYYRWEYEETWKFHARYVSDYIVDLNAVKTDSIRFRKPEEQAYYCYHGDKSSTIVLASSAKLAQDVIFQAPITDIPSTSEKIEMRYSILIRQYALTKEAYQFWENLKKNTEQLGSIFDAQPSQLKGNIHNLKDANEPVIGYISITNRQKKRVFIDNAQLPANWATTYPYDCGSVDSALIFNAKSKKREVKTFIVEGGSIPLEPIYLTGSNLIIGYTYSTYECSDCKLRGSIHPPSFWK